MVAVFSAPFREKKRVNISLLKNDTKSPIKPLFQAVLSRDLQSRDYLARFLSAKKQSSPNLPDRSRIICHLSYQFYLPASVCIKSCDLKKELSLLGPASLPTSGSQHHGDSEVRSKSFDVDIHPRTTAGTMVRTFSAMIKLYFYPVYT